MANKGLYYIKKASMLNSKVIRKQQSKTQKSPIQTNIKNMLLVFMVIN